MENIVNLWNQFYKMIETTFQAVPASYVYRLLTVLLGVILSFLFYFIMDWLNSQMIILEARLRIATTQVGNAFGIKKKNKGGRAIRTGNVIVPHPLFTSKVDQDDMYDLSDYPWSLIYIGSCTISVVMANLDPLADHFINSLYAFVIGMGIVYAVQWFLRYIRRIQMVKHLMDTLDILVNEIAVQRNSLNLAIQRIRNDYIQHYTRFGTNSWYYKNPVLSRLVYLASTQTTIVPLDVLRTLGKDLGEVDILAGIVLDVEPKIASVGDAGAAFRESILDYREEYIAQQSEKIPQYNDKLFIPILITHFLPLLIIILWPVMDTIYNMLAGSALNSPSFK